ELGRTHATPRVAVAVLHHIAVAIDEDRLRRRRGDALVRPALQVVDRQGVVVVQGEIALGGAAGSAEVAVHRLSGPTMIRACYLIGTIAGPGVVAVGARAKGHAELDRR